MTHRLHKGKPKTADIPTRAVLEAVEGYRTDAKQEIYKRPYVRLMEAYGCAEKVADRAVEREVNRGLLDYGVSLASPWLTPEGVAYLEGDNDGTTA